MNIQHLRYAVEVEKTRSITEAAENLYMSQPNLSRGIRELEGVLGITIFDRTPKGIVPTAQGEEFLHYASSILAQFDEMTERYSQKSARRRMLRLSVPRSSYIAQAFARFAQLADPSLTLDYKETNALRSIRNVTEDGYDLGIVRFQADYEKYFTDTFREKGLQYRELWSFRYLAMLRVDHPAARKEIVSLSDLGDSVSIIQGDLYVPALPRENRGAEDRAARVIQLYDRTSQFELVASLPRAYAWVSPVPEEMLSRYHLTLRPCADYPARHKDVLIYRKQYMLSPMDDLFLEQLSNVQAELSRYTR
ncbi:MAG TPA: LysR family transcriptional regulator [Candidatus Limiplasma sp.]|nr:LysR family transcriptional regulator [Candidatus Limiplasma sp.]